MTEPTREEKCRVIALWLGWRETANKDYGVRPLYANSERWPDFYADEEWNMFCFEAMPMPHLWKNPNGQWTCEPNNDEGVGEDVIATDPERKTAVAEAAYLLAKSTLKPA